MPNHLIDEISPYLLQHAHNPVDWYPWNEEALQKARTENKPIFLSIGYAACHWCHVMEHESFESPAVAQILNENFISIKVDREERPDLDRIYMTALIALSGQGGWPMSIFLTPDLKPFFGGTYFPPVQRYRTPSFQNILLGVIEAWKNKPYEILEISNSINQHLKEQASWNTSNPTDFTSKSLENAARMLIQTYDWQYGGWGGAPRFPAPMLIEFLIQQASDHPGPEILRLIQHILTVMNRGGLYDIVGGGFHRYSTDNSWLVPHFEKMLYDNAQLALVYLHGYLLTGDITFKYTCEETLDFIQREMLHPSGGFFSSLDADSDDGEGHYYLWTLDELQTILSQEEFVFLSRIYSLPENGNFERKIILKKTGPDETLSSHLDLSLSDFRLKLQAIHQKLFAYRSQRNPPAADDKVITAWNALALKAFAEAARYLKRADYLTTAQNCARFLLQNSFKGHLFRSWRDGKRRQHAYLEDYSSLAVGLLSLYEADHNPDWFQASINLTEEMFEKFEDPRGGFFDTPNDQPNLLVRTKETQDNVTPCGNASAAYALLLLSTYNENAEWHACAEKSIALTAQTALHYPQAFAFWLQAMNFSVGPATQIIILYSPSETNQKEYQKFLNEKYRPKWISVVSDYPPSPKAPAILRETSLLNTQTTIYICRDSMCLPPVNTLEELKTLI